MAGEFGGRAEAREHEELRAAESALGNNDFAPRRQRGVAAPVPHQKAGGAGTLHQDAQGAGAGEDGEVGAREDRVQVGGGGGAAFALARAGVEPGGLVKSGAVLNGAVEVGFSLIWQWVAAWMKAMVAGLGWVWSSTCRGPSSPWRAEAPRTLPSARRNQGRTEAQSQPLAPAAAQAS